MIVDARTGRLKQSVCQWCYDHLPLDDLAAEVADRGMVGIDLLGPADFETIKRHDLVCTMVTSHKLEDGLCDPQFHSTCIDQITASIEATAAEGWRNVICFTGNARGIDREMGMRNCITALEKVLPLAEAKGVTLVMELLNSRVDHPDYMCDRSEWGVELVRRTGSPNFGLLFDLYHMQIMEGDLIRTIQRDHAAFAHYHTAGNPGRHELDKKQELYYPAIAEAIADTGFEGYLAHEFVAKEDPLKALTDAVRQCIV